MEEYKFNYFKSDWLRLAVCITLTVAPFSGNLYATSSSGEKIELQANKEQQKVLTGLVLDYQGEPVIGASVKVVGAKTGVTTTVDGTFSIQVSSSSVLEIYSIGFVKKQIKVGNQTQLTVNLVNDDVSLNEVVVIGYGTQKKVDVTSSVASVRTEDFNKGAVLDAGQLVQGKVAGLQISLPSGDPDASTSVMLRGTSTLKGTTDPLILIDGVPGSFATVSPQDIESIDVLKDGSATAIYGTRGTNGVIIITTKGSKRDQPSSIDYEGYASISQQSRKADFMDADDLIRRMAEGYSFSGANDQNYGAKTNWLDEISRVAFSQVHNLTFRGGSNQTGIVGNVTYEKREGTFKSSDVTNLRGRLEITHRMYNDRLTTHISMYATERETGPKFSNDIYRQACIQNPTQPIYKADGSYVERPVYFYDNPVSLINETKGETRTRTSRFTIQLEYKLFKEVLIKGMYTRKGSNYLDGYYYTKLHPTSTEGGKNGYASRYTSSYVNNMGEFTVDWHHNFGLHKLAAVAGYNYEDNMDENFYVNNYNFPTDDYSYNKLEAGTALSKGEAEMTSYKESNKLIGLFGRVTYNYADRYLLMASIRRDGSSRFGADHKWGTFPGLSAGWRISNEEFMKPYTWISNLKLRGGFGVTGIDNSNSYVSLASLNYGDKFLYNGEWISSLKSVRNPNPDLRWEKKYEYNIGLDFDFFNGRLGGSIDAYRRDTKDALWDYTVPVPPYIYNTITANVGQIRNTGFELLINAIPIKTKDLEWSANISYSTNKNKVISISNDQFQMSTDWFTTGSVDEPIQTTSHRVKVGDPIGNFFGLKSIGVDQNGKWVVERYNRDASGNITGKYYDLAENATDEDRQVLGNGVPKHYLNFNNNIRYKRFDFSINMRGAFGFQILNYQRMYYSNPTIQYNVLNSAFDRLDVVDVVSGKKTGQKVVLNDAQRYVSEYIENGDYWKIDNITVGYTFDMSKSKYIKNLRLYVSCLNLATITGYKGIDPEVQTTGLDAGVDNRNKYPTTRSYTFGVNITF